MRVAVADDDDAVLERVRDKIEILKKEKQMDLCVKYYSQARRISTELETTKPCDLYILDIEMAEMNGMALAKKIREMQEKAYIVFLTDHLQYALQGYEVKAWQYILKEDLDKKLSPTIQSIYQEIEDSEKSVLTLDTNLCYERIAYEDIFYIYKEKKNAIIVTKRGNRHIRTTLQEMYNEISQEQFVFVDRGCIVNVQKIDRLKGNELSLSDGKTMTVSRTHTAEVREKIRTYWRDRL